MRTQSFIAGLVAILAVFGLFIAENLGADDRICSPGYARSQRVDRETAAYLKQEVMRRDARSLGCEPAPAKAGGPCSPKDFELDHIVPLCLGGTNALGNLQLQHWSEAKLKDGIEAQVCRAYCAGKVKGQYPAEALAKAREFFSSGDWRDGYLLQELLLP